MLSERSSSPSSPQSLQLIDTAVRVVLALVVAVRPHTEVGGVCSAAEDPAPDDIRGDADIVI